MADLVPVPARVPAAGGRRNGSRARLLAQLLATSLAAYCGAKGSPQPPLSEPPVAADAGPADGGQR
jgi:hypothetical protein